MDLDEWKLLEEAREILSNSNKSNKLSDEVLICECMCVSMGQIRELVNEKEVDLDLLSREFGLGTGCSSCLKSFIQWKDQV
ncbi:MAG: (2Fe-2S)-binding protein [Bacteriovoracaceae bacterium]|nr:(2Fe-2S)-binding protein [Bacteriovoracaceae bacterium]